MEVNKMELPISIGSAISRINQSEDKWKALYMATWGYSYWIKAQFENTENWDKRLEFGLPASKNSNRHIYTPNQIHSILTSRDGEFTIGHLQTLFSLFEDLIKESSKILYSQEVDASKWEEIKKFFDENNDIVSDSELKELKLAKVTRNCYIHNNGKINQRWIDAYTEAKGSTIASIGDELERGFPNSFHQIEEWNELIVKTTGKIKEKIELK